MEEREDGKKGGEGRGRLKNRKERGGVIIFPYTLYLTSSGCTAIAVSPNIVSIRVVATTISSSVNNNNNNNINNNISCIVVVVT